MPTTQFCAGEPSDAGLAAAYNWSFDGVGVRAADEMCDKMRVRIHETALVYAVAADGRLWVRSCSAKSPFANRDAQRLGSLLQKLLDAAPSPIPSVQMLVNHGDQPVMQKAQLGGGLPVFEPSCAPAYWCVAMPSPFHVARALGVPGSQPPNATAFPWAARTSKAWWRGELAVPDHTLRSTLLTLPRLKVLSIARQRPDLMDVRLSGLDHDSLEHALGADDIGARAHDLLLAAGLDEAEANAVASGENYAPFATHGPRFRFQLSLHAVISSWRLHELLLSGSALLLQEHAVAEWLSARLVPWEHYIPVADDLSDLVARIEWLRADDDRARRLAESALRVGRQAATADAVFCFFARALDALRALPHDAELFASDARLREAGYRPADDVWPGRHGEGADRRRLPENCGLGLLGQPHRGRVVCVSLAEQ
jgi:hypothetical protein